MDGQSAMEPYPVTDSSLERSSFMHTACQAQGQNNKHRRIITTQLQNPSAPATMPTANTCTCQCESLLAADGPQQQYQCSLSSAVAQNQATAATPTPNTHNFLTCCWLLAASEAVAAAHTTSCSCLLLPLFCPTPHLQFYNSTISHPVATQHG